MKASRISCCPPKEILSAQMTQISSAYNYYQQSDVLAELLNGAHPDASSTLYYYFKDLVPLFKRCKDQWTYQKCRHLRLQRIFPEYEIRLWFR